MLLIADNGDRIQHIESTLAKAPFTKIELTTVDCMGDASTSLGKAPCDVVLIDLIDPTSRQCRQAKVVSYFRRIHADVPIIALSDENEPDVIVRGAQDCIPSRELESATMERILQHAVLRHALTEQLRHANRLLDRKSSELRRANEQLRHKNSRLKAHYETAQEFVDHVSHEFRTPLTVIKEYATILADGLVGQVSSKQKEFLEIIDSRTDDLAYLIDDMLDVSRLQAGMIGIHRKDCTAAEIFERVRSILEPKAAKKGIALSFRIDGTLSRVFCDPEKIGRVIINLAVNAMKVSDEGQTVEIWARPGETAGEISIGVTDEGPGICADDRKKIFDRFRQVDGPSKERIDGFGLGLSIARDLVALNFGELDLESAPGQGSTFSFSIPCWNAKGLVSRYLRTFERLEDPPIPLSVLDLKVRSDSGKKSHEVLDRFLQNQGRRHDLVLPLSKDRWLAFVRCEQSELFRLTRRWRESWAKANGNDPDVRLPDFDMHPRGTWKLPDEAAEVIQHLRPDLLTSARTANASCVLVVDDDRDFANGLHLQLGAAGYSAKTVRDAETAIKLAEQLRPKAILLDNSLPGMNGLEALERLQQNPNTQEIPVIMLSANTKLQQQALEANARYCLKKPCGFDAIVSALKQVSN